MKKPLAAILAMLLLLMATGASAYARADEMLDASVIKNNAGETTGLPDLGIVKEYRYDAGTSKWTATVQFTNLGAPEYKTVGSGMLPTGNRIDGTSITLEVTTNGANSKLLSLDKMGESGSFELLPENANMRRDLQISGTVGRQSEIEEPLASLMLTGRFTGTVPLVIPGDPLSEGLQFELNLATSSPRARDRENATRILVPSGQSLSLTASCLAEGAQFQLKEVADKSAFIKWTDNNSPSSLVSLGHAGQVPTGPNALAQKQTFEAVVQGTPGDEIELWATGQYVLDARQHREHSIAYFTNVPVGVIEIAESEPASTPTPESSATATPPKEPVASPSPSILPDATPTPLPSILPDATPTPSPSVLPDATFSPTPAPTPTETPSAQPEPSSSPAHYVRVLPGTLTVRTEADANNGTGIVESFQISTPDKMRSVADAQECFDYDDGLYMTMMDKNGAPLPDGQRVATGDSAVFRDRHAGDVFQRYLFVVPGDTLGTAQMSLSQLVQMAKEYRVSSGDGTGTYLVGVYRMAADLTRNGLIDLSDLVKEAGIYRDLWSYTLRAPAWRP